ncbi:hypothetical protein JKF63_02130 [Porcisia hertigi]|uniref:Uncharacterized protein n=1 Tax=Porcisia hertigi TaxID=2761500 RepID=A0A836HYX9_9TRYP|nr:hypothetical protein JKF63_02130 [Porcisia hertigi]
MSSEEYEGTNIASDEESSVNDVEEDEEEDARSSSAEEQELKLPHSLDEESEEEDYDAFDETPLPKPFPKTISLILPRQARAGAACEPTCVHVCLTRGMIGRRLPERGDSNSSDKQDDDEDEEEEEEEEAAPTIQRAAAPGKGSADEDSEDDDDDADSAAAKLMGCCADNHCYEKDYAVPLAALRRRLILRHLHGDTNRQRRFLLSDLAHRKRERQSRYNGAAYEEEEDGDGDEEEAGGGSSTDPLEGVVWPWTTVQQPPPYWLPALLSNDALTFQRVLCIMYGWVIAPDPHPSDKLQLDADGQLCTSTQSPEREREHAEQTEELNCGPQNLEFVSSHPFSDEEGDATDGTSHEASRESANQQILTPVQATAKSLLGELNECEADEEVHQSDEEVHDQQHAIPSLDGSTPSHVRLSVSTAPPPVSALPYFPFAEYELFIAYDKVSGEWHLLDTHPLLVMQACRRRRAEEMSQEEDQQGDKAVDATPLDSDEERESGTESDEGEITRKGVKKSFRVPGYVLDGIIPVSPVVLAALFSPAALRCCLLQPLQDAPKNHDDADHAENYDTGSDTAPAAATPSVSAHAVLRTFDNAWLSVDMAVALPILATICRTRQRVLQQDAPRIPYALGHLWIDVNPLYTLPGFANAAEPQEKRRWRAPPGQHSEDDENEMEAEATPMKVADLSFPHRWGIALDSIIDPSNYGRLVLNALLDAGILPTRPVEVKIFSHLRLLRLTLWWWMRLPPKVIREWGVDAAADGLGVGDNAEDDDALENSSEDGVEDGATEEELDEMSVEDVTEFLLERIQKMNDHDARLRRLRLRKEHATLVFAPLLQRVLLELQRRLDRMSAVDARGAPVAPSQYTLQESVSRTYVAELLESGRPRQDPLVTAAFVGLADPASPTLASVVRHQRLYQSDLVLLLLAFTTTPAPLPSRVATILDDAETRFSTIAAKNISEAEAEAVNDQETQSNDVDAHTTLFSHLLDFKLMRFVRRPQDRTRAGTTKLLLLCAIDFCRGATRQRVFGHLPRFELFGSTGYCPLPELVQAWSSVCGSNMSNNHSKKLDTVRLFAYYMWNEIRWRLHKRQYSDAVVARMRQQLPELFEMIDLHISTYNAILAHLDAETAAESEANDSRNRPLSGPAAEGGTPPPGATPRTPQKPCCGVSSSPDAAARRQCPFPVCTEFLPATREEEQEEAGLYSTSSSHVAHYPPQLSVPAPTPLPLTLAYPNAYSAEVLESKARIIALWRSFIVAPHTYMNAETLHALLFGRNAQRSEVAERAAVSRADDTRRFHTAALRVMFENGITSVQSCPLDGPETPAIEEAMRRADLQAVKILLGLGAASLQDTSLKGNATVESWAEQLFSPAEMEVLRFVAYKNKSVMGSDPRVQFGTRRFGRALPSS